MTQATIIIAPNLFAFLSVIVRQNTIFEAGAIVGLTALYLEKQV